MTLLHSRKMIEAVHKGHQTDLVNALKRGADPNAVIEGRHALGVAADRSDEVSIKVLLAAGADVNRRDAHGYTALLRALDRGNPRTSWSKTKSVISALIDAGADADIPCDAGASPLWLALGFKRKDVVSTIFAHSRDLRAALSTRVPRWEEVAGVAIIHRAARAGNVEIVGACIQAGVDVNTGDEFGATALFYASTSGMVEVARYLITCGAEVDRCAERLIKDESGSRIVRYASMHKACEYQQTAVVRLLLESGSQACWPGECGTPIEIASMVGCEAIVRLLIKHKRLSGQPLIACFRDAFNVHPSKMRVMDLLLRAGCDPNSVDDLGRSALHHAALAHHVAVVRRLMLGGCSVAIKDKSGKVAAELVAEKMAERHARGGDGPRSDEIEVLRALAE